MQAPQRFGGGPPSPEDSDLTIDLKLPFDRRKTAEPPRPGKGFPDSRAQQLEQPAPQRGGRRVPDRVADEPSPVDPWKSSQRHRTPSPEQSSPPLSSRTTKQSAKQSMLGYSSIESMKQELRELKMMLSREKEAKEESYERKRPRTPSDAGSYSRGGRSPSPIKRRRESYSPIHRRRGRSPVDSYRRPSPPSYRRERRESPYYRGAATPSARRYSPSPGRSLSPSSDRSVGKRWSPSPPPRHRRPEGRTPGRRWSPESPPSRPRRSSVERTPKHPSSQTPYYQSSSQPGQQPPYYDSGQPSGPPLVPPPNLSVPPPNYPMNAPPPQAPYFAGYPPPAQAPADFSYPPPSAQQQQTALRSNLRVVPLQSGSVDNAVKEERSFSPANVKQEEKVIPKKLPPVTQEEIDNYLSLVEAKDSHREKLNLLKQELVRLSKIQNEMMRRRQHKRDGHRDPSLLESSSMYEDVKKQVMEVNGQMEEVTRKIFKVSQRVKMEAIAYKKQQEEEALAAESPDTAGIKFVYEDPRDHWCQQCNVVVPTMNDMFRHLHSPKHKEATPSHERPWADLEKPAPPTNQKFHRTIVSSVKGVQFLVGISGYYCKLCKVMSGDSAMARNHLHSLEHNQNYTKYILLNPYYERRWKMEKDLALVSAIKEEKEEKEKQEKEREKSRSRSPSERSSSKRHKSNRKEEQEKIRRKNEELQKQERENSASVKELDDSETSPKKGAKSMSPPPSRAPTGGSGIKLKLLKGQKVQKQTPKQAPVVIIGKAPCFRPSFLSGKSKAGGASNATTKQEESKPYGPALPPNLASASDADLVEEAKKNEAAMEIPLPAPASESQAPAPATTTEATENTATTAAATANTATATAASAPVMSVTQAPRKQALKSGIVAKVTSLPSGPKASMTEEDMDLKLLGIERDDIQPIAPVKPPPVYGPVPPPAVQLPNLSVPPPMFPVPPPKRTLLPPPQYLATVPPPTLAPLNVPPPTATLHVRPHLLTHGRPFVANADYVKPNNNRVTCNTVVPLQVLRLPPPPPPDEPEPPALPVTRARLAAAQRPPPTLTPIQRAVPTAGAPTTAEPQKPTRATEPSINTAGGKNASAVTTRAAPELSEATTGDANAAATEPSTEGVKPEVQDADMTVATVADVASECAAEPVTESVTEIVAPKPSKPTTPAEACALLSHEPHKVAVPEGIASTATGSSPAINSAALALENAAEPVTETSNEAVEAEVMKATTQGEALQLREPHNVAVSDDIAPIASGSSPSISSATIALERAAETVTESVTEVAAAKASEPTTRALRSHEPLEVVMPAVVQVGAGSSLAVSSADVSLESSAQPVTEQSSETVMVKSSEPTTQYGALQSHEPHEVTVPEGVPPIVASSSLAISSTDVSLGSATQPVTEPGSEAVTAKPSELTPQGEALQSKEFHDAALPEKVAPIADDISLAVSEGYVGATKVAIPSWAADSEGKKTEDILNACMSIQQQVSADASPSQESEVASYPSFLTEANAEHAAASSVGEKVSEPSKNIQELHRKKTSDLIDTEVMTQSEPRSSALQEQHVSAASAVIEANKVDISIEGSNTSTSGMVGEELYHTAPSFDSEKVALNLSESAPISSYFNLRAGPTSTETGQGTVSAETKRTCFQPEDFSARENVTANPSLNDKANTVEDVSSENDAQISGILGSETSIPVDQNVDSCSSGATEIEEDVSGRMEVNYGDSEEPFTGEEETFQEGTAMLAPERGELVTEGLTAPDTLDVLSKKFDCGDCAGERGDRVLAGNAEGNKEVFHNVMGTATGCAQLTMEDATVAQFVHCTEEESSTAMEEEDSIATADARESCAGIGGVSETSGRQADAEVPFASFDKQSSAGDCSVPVVTTLGLDSLLDDCPDWKTAILDATNELDNSMPGESLFNRASVSEEPLANAIAAGGVAQDGARSEERVDDSNPSRQLLQPDSDEVPLEDASLGAAEPVLEHAKVSTEDECVLEGDFAVVDECSDNVVQTDDDDCMVVMDQA
uniref:Zinc finger protein n=1 Tax=Rhipicephalus zambeziensis TaxID=60191 RepID=A0A224Z5S2_9ACAR